MGAFLARPLGTPRGGIVLLQEIFGVTPAMRAIAEDLATAGFAVVVPDIFWRLQPNLNLGNGEDVEQRQLAVEYSQRYDEQQGTVDLLVAADWLADELQLARRPVVMGFCIGGRMAVRVAAAATARFSGMISMYGVGLDKLAQDIRSISCPMQFHFGDNDNHNPTAVIDAVADVVASRHRQEDEFFVYPGAEHAFYNRYRKDRFHASAHELARSRILEFFRKYLAR